MDKSQSYQIVKLSFIVALFLITPLLSTSVRPPYLYFLTNLLIIALGAEAGFLSSSPDHAEERKPSLVVTPKPNIIAVDETFTTDKLVETLDINQKIINSTAQRSCVSRVPGKSTIHSLTPFPESVAFNINQKTSETSARSSCFEKVSRKSNVRSSLTSFPKKSLEKQCPSTPSIFFIGGSEPEERKEAVEEEEEGACLSGQELFTRAETFIGNFYKQLKIQREDSWKQIHGFHQTAS